MKPNLNKCLFGEQTTLFLQEFWPDEKFSYHGELSTLPFAKDKNLSSANALIKHVLKSGKNNQIRVWLQDTKGQHKSANLTPDSALNLYESGKVTLVIDKVDQIIPSISKYMIKMSEILGVSRDKFTCNAYCSPKNEGTVIHFDSQEVFFVQLKGKKRWKIAPNKSIPFPTESYFPGAAVNEINNLSPNGIIKIPRSTESVILKQGSILFLPRGYWHESHTIEESLALTFTFTPPTWADLILSAVRQRLIQDEEWRKSAVGLNTNGLLSQKAHKRFEALMEDFTKIIQSMKA